MKLYCRNIIYNKMVPHCITYVLMTVGTTLLACCGHRDAGTGNTWHWLVGIHIVLSRYEVENENWEVTTIAPLKIKFFFPHFPLFTTRRIENIGLCTNNIFPIIMA